MKEYDIILECNGKKIDEDNPLADVLQEHKIGEEISLKILRENKKINVKVKLVEKR